MKRRKRILAVILSCAMAAATLAGCNSAGNSSSGGNTDNSGNVNTGEGKVKLTALFVKHSLTKDLNTMQWLTDLEEKYNVEIEWQQISADWDQKKSAMFASGEIPDLLFGATVDSDYVQYNGLFEDMKPLIEQYAPNIQSMFKEVPATEVMATTMEGKIFGIPSYKSLWPQTVGTTFINKEWLDAVNMEVPTTWDELEKVLKAFKEQDANGNGDPNDEIPMDFNGGFEGGFSAIHLLSSTGMQVSADQDGYFVQDGKVQNYYIDERFKRVMKFVQRLWSQGLINEEAVTQDYSKYQSLARGEGTTAKVGFTWGWESGDRFGNEVQGQYVSVPPIKENEDTENVRYAYDFYGQNYVSNRVAMSAKCKDKEAAMKFVDGFYDELVSMQVLFGGMNDIDICIKDNGDGSYEVLPPADTDLDPGTWKWTNSFADNGAFYIRDGLKLKLGSDMQRVKEEKSVYDDCLSAVDRNKDVFPQLFMKYTQEDTNSLAMNQANIDNIVDQTWSAWMTDSSRDIDAEWDSFVESVKNSGLTQNLEIRQKAYDEYLKTVE
ncbi:extracellular solute-binding protein [Eisenbergiella tayi]|uniref:Lipoprotein LipO n=1 Tax=Eisenbergiella tayi TaxID=1432052 RepID=A0A1E3AES1_9FIRM|nr:extracellular solute-binding protein [Eisenbergiella tayi]ODM07203.1 Lipoprotein LipO precursor [Eisenbergiella tayi]